MQRRFALLLSLAVPLAGCAAGPEYRPSGAAALGVPDTYSVSADQQTHEDLTRWWSRFDDPLLGRLVEQGRTANLDVAQAVARLRQARESLVQARASLLPTVSGSAGYSRDVNVAGPVTGGAKDTLSLGLDASYQADIFGATRRSIETARAQYQGSGYSYAATMLSVEAEIARNYMLARLYQAQIANARASLAIQDDNLQIARWRVQAGLVSSLDVESARSQRAATAATIPTLESSYNTAVSRLGVLTGQAPGALKSELAAVKPIPSGPASVGTGIPADTLRQRPDVRSAERALAAATAQIGVAQASLYPSLSLGGSFSTSASTFGSIGNVIAGQLFANLAQTIFDGGRLRSQVRAYRAAADESFASYKLTVLTALEDVENAVVALETARQRERDYTEALDAANNSAILSRSQYQSGLTDFTTLSTAEAALLTARNNLAQARSDQATALVQLYVALGGGWDETAAPDTLPAAVAAASTSTTSQDR